MPPPDPAIVERFRRELRPAERVLWTGRPDTHRLFSPIDVFLVPFGLFYLGFAVVWTTLAYSMSEEGSRAFALFGIPFIAMGLYLTFGRLWYGRWRRQRMFYAVTDRRGMVLVDRATRNVRSVSLDGVTSVEKRVRRDGSGVFAFGHLSWWHLAHEVSGLGVLLGGFLWWLIGDKPLIFLDVPDVDNVDRLATALIERARQRAPVERV
jgi:hypothetical protein